jgi:hypothetical protein
MRAWIQLELDQYCPGIEGDLDALITQYSPDLVDARAKQAMLLDELFPFKQQNGLSAMPVNMGETDVEFDARIRAEFKADVPTTQFMDAGFNLDAFTAVPHWFSDTQTACMNVVSKYD